MSQRIDPRRGRPYGPNAGPEAPVTGGAARLEGCDRAAGTGASAEAGQQVGALSGERGGALAVPPLSPPGARRRDRRLPAPTEAGRPLPPPAPAVSVEVLDPAHPDAAYCLGTYTSELHGILDGGFDPANSLLPDLAPLRAPRGLFLVARLHGAPVGCAGLKLPPGEPAEIKRLWVSPRARGLGLSRHLLAALEGHAARHGRDLIQLDTNNALQAAVRLYRSSGYVEVPAFNDEPYANLWFGKRLSPTGTAENHGDASRPCANGGSVASLPQAPAPALRHSIPPPSAARTRPVPSAAGRCRNSPKSPAP